MAGSYNHIVNDQGNFVSNETFAQKIENLGDAFEMAEEMYGMIWWLASLAPDAAAMTAEDLVEMARQNYPLGLELARANKNKQKYRP